MIAKPSKTILIKITSYVNRLAIHHNLNFSLAETAYNSSHSAAQVIEALDSI